MRKLNFTLTLPILNLLVACALLGWHGQYNQVLGDTRALCFALNAPIMLLLAPFYWNAPMQSMPRSVLGIRSDNLLVLVAIALLWLMIGLVLDRLNWREMLIKSRSKHGAILLRVILAALGIWLIAELRPLWQIIAQDFVFWRFLDCSIVILWAILFVVPLLKTCIDGMHIN